MKVTLSRFWTIEQYEALHGSFRAALALTGSVEGAERAVTNAITTLGPDCSAEALLVETARSAFDDDTCSGELSSCPWNYRRYLSFLELVAIVLSCLYSLPFARTSSNRCSCSNCHAALIEWIGWRFVSSSPRPLQNCSRRAWPLVARGNRAEPANSLPPLAFSQPNLANPGPSAASTIEQGIGEYPIERRIGEMLRIRDRPCRGHRSNGQKYTLYHGRSSRIG